MKKISKACLLLLGLPLAACGGGDVSSEMSAFTRKMCECTTAECANAVHEEYKKWEDQAEKKFKELSADTKAALDKLDAERQACRRRARKEQ